MMRAHRRQRRHAVVSSTPAVVVALLLLLVAIVATTAPVESFAVVHTHPVVGVGANQLPVRSLRPQQRWIQTSLYNQRGGSTEETNTDDTTSLTKQRQQKDDETTIEWNAIARQFTLFRRLAAPYFTESNTGRQLLGILLVLTLANSGVSVAFSYLSKDFWNALSARNAEEFANVLTRYLGALLVGAPVVTFYRYQRQQLALHWREWMTDRTLQLYRANRVYYRLPYHAVAVSDLDDNTEQDTALRESEIDNPDQRITEDVRSFTAYSLQLGITVLTSMIDLVAFSSILWSIYPQLFVILVAYAFVGTAVTAWLGKSLVPINVGLLRREADLRYVLVRWRDQAESIALLAGEEREGRQVQERLTDVVNQKRSLNKGERNLEFFTTAYRYLVQIVPVAVVAPKYFAREIELGVISQAVGAFNHILSDLSIIVNQFEQLSSFAAGLERLETFYEGMLQIDKNRTQLLSFDTPASSSTVETNTKADETGTISSRGDASLEFGTIDLSSCTAPVVLKIANLDLCTPDRKRTLIRNLDVTLQEGQNLLIVGNSGAGKSSLLRAVAGLWTDGNGAIQRPEDIYFLPQRPYCTLGTLKDQLLYPAIEGFNATAGTTEETMERGSHHVLHEGWSDEDLLKILDQVYLTEVASEAGDGDPTKGLHAVLDWSNRLSLGEQQRLSFGRLMVNRPKLVVLDEATSALDITGEARMYNLLQNMARREFTGVNGGLSAPGLTYVSVGHRPSLLAFHDKRLRVLGGKEASCEMDDIPKSSAQVSVEQIL